MATSTLEKSIHRASLTNRTCLTHDGQLITIIGSWPLVDEPIGIEEEIACKTRLGSVLKQYERLRTLCRVRRFDTIGDR